MHAKSGYVEGESMMASITALIWANDNLVKERQYYKQPWWFSDAQAFIYEGLGEIPNCNSDNTSK